MDDDGQFRVVVNDEGQYSLWPDDRDPPRGWHDEGTRGTKQDCLDRIKTVWTDLRPISLRKQMAGLR